MTRNYELIYIIPGKIEEKETQTVINKVKQLIQETEIKIIKSENWGKKRLAYPIKQNQHGYYILDYLESKPVKIKELNKKLKMIPEIIRYQIVRSEEIKSETKKEETKKEKVKQEKVSLEELDKKIEEILKD